MAKPRKEREKAQTTTETPETDTEFESWERIFTWTAQAEKLVGSNSAQGTRKIWQNTLGKLESVIQAGQRSRISREVLPHLMAIQSEIDGLEPRSDEAIGVANDLMGLISGDLSEAPALVKVWATILLADVYIKAQLDEDIFDTFIEKINGFKDQDQKIVDLLLGVFASRWMLSHDSVHLDKFFGKIDELQLPDKLPQSPIERERVLLTATNIISIDWIARSLGQLINTRKFKMKLGLRFMTISDTQTTEAVTNTDTGYPDQRMFLNPEYTISWAKAWEGVAEGYPIAPDVNEPHGPILNLCAAAVIPSEALSKGRIMRKLGSVAVDVLLNGEAGDVIEPEKIRGRDALSLFIIQQLYPKLAKSFDTFEQGYKDETREEVDQEPDILLWSNNRYRRKMRSVDFRLEYSQQSIQWLITGTAAERQIWWNGEAHTVPVSVLIQSYIDQHGLANFMNLWINGEWEAEQVEVLHYLFQNIKNLLLLDGEEVITHDFEGNLLANPVTVPTLHLRDETKIVEEFKRYWVTKSPTADKAEFMLVLCLEQDKASNFLDYARNHWMSEELVGMNGFEAEGDSESLTAYEFLEHMIEAQRADPKQDFPEMHISVQSILADYVDEHPQLLQFRWTTIRDEKGPKALKKNAPSFGE